MSKAQRDNRENEMLSPTRFITAMDPLVVHKVRLFSAAIATLEESTLAFSRSMIYHSLDSLAYSVYFTMAEPLLLAGGHSNRRGSRKELLCLSDEIPVYKQQLVRLRMACSDSDTVYILYQIPAPGLRS